MSGKAYIPALNALRGFAVLIVFISHAANDGLLPRWLGHGSGQMGVQLFFMLSGYLMMQLYADLPSNPQNIRLFIAGRIAKILPLYWLVLATSLCIATLGYTPHYQFASALEFTGAAMFLHAGQELWSIPVEMQFYGAFVFLWLGISHLRAQFWLLLPVAFALAILWKGLVSDAATLFLYAPTFLIGVFLCFYQSRLKNIKFLARPIPATLCLVFFALNLPGLRGAIGLEVFTGFYPRLWLDPLRILALVLIFLSALTPGTWIWRNGSGLHHLGKISFCVYLIHRPILNFVSPALLPGPIQAGIVLVVCVLVATLSLRYFERPVGSALKAFLVAPMRRLQRLAAR